MAIFPEARTLIVPPSQLWSRGKTVTVNGTTKEKFPPANAVDGSSGTPIRSEYGTDAVKIDLGAAQTPNIFGVIHSNIDYDRVCGFHASASAGFGSLLLDRGAAARYPNFWLDLRGFPATAQYWRFAVNSNSQPLSIGEIVIGTGLVFNGVLQGLPPEEHTYWQERGLLEYGKVAVSASGALTRALTLALEMSAAEAAQLESIADEAVSTGDPIVVVPDTRRNEIYYMHWPEEFQLEYSRSGYAEIRASLRLLEEGAGVV